MLPNHQSDLAERLTGDLGRRSAILLSRKSSPRTEAMSQSACSWAPRSRSSTGGYALAAPARVRPRQRRNWQDQLAGVRYDAWQTRLIYHHHDPEAASQHDWLYHGRRVTERFPLVRDRLATVLDLVCAERCAALLETELRGMPRGVIRSIGSSRERGVTARVFETTNVGVRPPRRRRTRPACRCDWEWRN